MSSEIVWDNFNVAFYFIHMMYFRELSGWYVSFAEKSMSLA